MSVVDQDSVVIVLKRSRRGYVVHALGSDEKFQCRDGASIGEACLDILEDPSQPRAEIEEGSSFAGPVESDRASRSSRAVARREQAFRPEPEPEDRGSEVMIGGRRTTTKDLQEAFFDEMDLADQMAYQAGAAVWGGLQKISSGWRKSGKKKKKKKKT